MYSHAHCSHVHCTVINIVQSCTLYSHPHSKTMYIVRACTLYSHVHCTAMYIVQPFTMYSHIHCTVIYTKQGIKHPAIVIDRHRNSHYTLVLTSPDTVPLLAKSVSYLVCRGIRDSAIIAQLSSLYHCSV